MTLLQRSANEFWRSHKYIGALKVARDTVSTPQLWYNVLLLVKHGKQPWHTTTCLAAVRWPSSICSAIQQTFGCSSAFVPDASEHNKNSQIKSINSIFYIIYCGNFNFACRFIGFYLNVTRLSYRTLRSGSGILWVLTIGELTIGELSQIRLSVVCNVRLPYTQLVKIFPNVYMTFCTLAIGWLLRRSSQKSPSVGG